MDSHEEERFIRSLVTTPDDRVLRLIYADWLDDRGDLRGAYLRSEDAWAANRSNEARMQLRDQAIGLDAVWVARVSRPPVGVCCDRVQFKNDLSDKIRPPLQPSDLDWLQTRFGIRLPADYQAFLLNYNGGSPTLSYFRLDQIEQQFGITIPPGYCGKYPEYTNDQKGSHYGFVAEFESVWAAADSVPDNSQADGDWSDDLVNNLQLLEYWRDGLDDSYAKFWREGVPGDLIWIGHSGPTGDHEVVCIGVRGDAFGQVYHVVTGPGYVIDCDEYVRLAPSFADFLDLLTNPQPKASVPSDGESD